MQNEALIKASTDAKHLTIRTSRKKITTSLQRHHQTSRNDQIEFNEQGMDWFTAIYTDVYGIDAEE